nr:hypothetical protein [Nostoc sp. TCL240-02]
MKAISLWQPHASLVPLGLKRHETRSWGTSYRGPLLICSAKRNQVSLFVVKWKPKAGQPMPWEIKQKPCKPKGGRNKKGDFNNFHNRDYDFVSPDGEIFTGKGVRQFAQEHELNESALLDVLNGRVHSCKGWTKAVGGRKLPVPPTYYFLSPAGVVHTTTNLSEFARQHGLCPIALSRISRCIIGIHRGWRHCTPDGQPIVPPDRKHRKFTLRSPTGENIEGSNLKAFAEQHGLSRTCLMNVLGGISKEHRGWTLPGIDAMTTTTTPNLGKLFTNRTIRPATDEDIILLAPGDWISEKECPWSWQFKGCCQDMIIGVWEGKEFFVPHHLLMVCEIIEGQVVEKFFTKPEPRFKVGDRVRDTFPGSKKQRKGAISDTPKKWAVVLWDGVSKPQQWSYEHLEKDSSWNPAHFGEVPHQVETDGQVTIFFDESQEPPNPDDFETIEKYEEAWEKWNLQQECFLPAAGVVQKARSQQDTNPSGQLKTIPTPQPSTESDSPRLNLSNKTLPDSLTNLSEISTVSISSLGAAHAQISALLENAPGLKELADNCFLSSSDVCKLSSLQLFCGSKFQQSYQVERDLTSSKSLMRLQRWGMWGVGKSGMENATSPKTENDYSVWVFTGDIRATIPSPEKKTLQEIFETQAIPVKVYVDGVAEATESPAICAAILQHRSPLHRDKRGASFAVLYRAAGGDRIYHEQSPCLRSPNNSGTGAYKIREYQGETYLERPINATEAEQLMGWEVGSTAIGINKEGDEIAISQTQRIKMIGNGIIVGEIVDILTAIKPILLRQLKSEIPEHLEFAYCQLRQKGMSHLEAINRLN